MNMKSYSFNTEGRSTVAKDKKEACLLAIQAGVNIELPEPDTRFPMPPWLGREVTLDPAFRKGELVRRHGVTVQP